MPTHTVENYVKAIYLIGEADGSGMATTSELARRLRVAPPSVTGMLRTLAESGLAEYQAREGVRLSAAGRRLALRVLRRHRLFELFLAKTLGLRWEEVHEEAEHLEHAVSDRLIDRMDEHLGFPERDPHGDPIPRADGSLPAVPGRPLDQCPTGTPVILERVLDQSADFLNFLRQHGLGIGSRGLVVENHSYSGVLTFKCAEHQINLSRDLAAKLIVREAGG